MAKASAAVTEQEKQSVIYNNTKNYCTEGDPNLGKPM